MTKPDWNTLARSHLRYLDKCDGEAERVEYMVLALKQTEAAGALRASGEMMHRLNKHGETVVKEPTK